jgi:hypothetical protein
MQEMLGVRPQCSDRYTGGRALEQTRHAPWNEHGCSNLWLIWLSINSRTIWFFALHCECPAVDSSFRWNDLSSDVSGRGRPNRPNEPAQSVVVAILRFPRLDVRFLRWRVFCSIKVRLMDPKRTLRRRDLQEGRFGNNSQFFGVI